MTLPCTDSSSKPKAKLNFGHLLPSSPHALSSSPANVLGKKRDFVCTTSGTSFSGRATPPALPKRSRKEQSDKVNDIDASDVPDFGAARSESDVTNDGLKVLQKIKVPKQKRPNVGEGVNGIVLGSVDARGDHVKSCLYSHQPFLLIDLGSWQAGKVLSPRQSKSDRTLPLLSIDS